MRRLYLAESLTGTPRYTRTMELRYHVCVCVVYAHEGMFTAMLSPDSQLRIMLNSNGNIFPPYLRVSYSSWTPNTESNTANLPVRRFLSPFLLLPLLSPPPPSSHSPFSSPSLLLPSLSSFAYKCVHLSLHPGLIQGGISSRQHPIRHRNCCRPIHHSSVTIAV